jgi:RNA polymerase sigma-70 factor (ECF subfamily)
LSAEVAAAEASRVAEAAARDAYGRLVAYLGYRFRDLAAAEDALGDALAAALETWPKSGVPERPEAWLLTAARRRLIDEKRRERVRSDPAVALLLAADAAVEAPENVFPDERLKLLFVCAHPAIDAAARTPLMLQTVLGLDAARIASAFLVAPAAMGQRLTRAKSKIRDAGLRFEVPGTEELPDRVDAVLDAIYAAYGSGWDDIEGADPRRRGLAEEAVWLARLLCGLMPAEPEARGLLALMLHCEARRAARRGRDGAFVPLSEQDTALWSRALMDEAEVHLAIAAKAASIGRFQLEAAIQSAHAQRAVSGHTPWAAVAHLYDGLVAIAPALGVLVGRAAAHAQAAGPAVAMSLLEDIATADVLNYQPYWALRADVLGRLGRAVEAKQCYGRAIGLAEDPAIRRFLQARAEQLPA